MGNVWIFLFNYAVALLWAFAEGVPSSQDPSNRFSSKDEDLFKELEYEVFRKNLSKNPSDLDEIDFNLIDDNIIAYEFTESDNESGLDDNAGMKEDLTSHDDVHFLMYKGIYEQTPRFNPSIDRLLIKWQNDMKKRRLEPIYFTVHKEGGVKHAPKHHSTSEGQLIRNDGQPLTENVAKKREGAIGAGDIEGLGNIRRFGHTESRPEDHITLVRSHYFFGPLETTLIFNTRKGLREVHSTLSSLAGHALYQVNESSEKNTKKLLEFFIDNPLPHDITLRGSRSDRLRRLNEEALLRLFRKGGKVERKMKRSLERVLRKDAKEQRRDNSQKKPLDAGVPVLL